MTEDQETRFAARREALGRYRELNRAEDELFLQGRSEEAGSIHLRLREMEQEAKRNGYILTVRSDSAWCAPDEEICFIERLEDE